MAPSFRKIDYSLRPAKHAERKMFVEMLQKVSNFRQIHDYQYVGLGSVWFTDFALFHRALNIKKMFSIEKEGQLSDRFEFNKPFGGIEMRFGTTTRELPKIDWTGPTVAWLDYDDSLSPEILADAKLVTSRAKSGHVFIVSVQAQDAPTFDDDGVTRKAEDREGVVRVFGEGLTPKDMIGRDLIGARLARLYCRIILNQIDAALADVNGPKPENERMSFKTISIIDYQDGVKMTSVAGMFVASEDEDKFNACDFQKLTFYSDTAEDATVIKVPMLTPREMRHIERSLPIADGTAPDFGTSPQSDGQAFVEFYRYLPSFASFEQ